MNPIRIRLTASLAFFLACGCASVGSKQLPVAGTIQDEPKQPDPEKNIFVSSDPTIERVAQSPWTLHPDSEALDEYVRWLKANTIFDDVSCVSPGRIEMKLPSGFIQAIGLNPGGQFQVPLLKEADLELVVKTMERILAELRGRTGYAGSVSIGIKQDEWFVGKFYEPIPEHSMMLKDDLETKVRSRRESFIASHQHLSENSKKSISDGKIFLGMTIEEVAASYGTPADIHRTVGAWGTHEQWIYPARSLYFENGILSSWQD